MSRFNLIDEQWIPVRFVDGSRGELGIQDTLLRSKEIGTIEDSSPLVMAALHRFLLAVLYRALEGPTDIEEAKKLFRDGLPSVKIRTYLKKWRDRFWLFDDQYPFGQIPEFQPKEWKAWSKLAAEYNADNAKVLFDHLDIKNPTSIPSSAAARWLLAAQTFDLAVAQSEFVQPLDAPSARAVFFIVLGNTLHDTFCFCLKPQGKHISQNDSALWEREPEAAEVLKSGLHKTILGYADLYTWRSRSIVLQDGECGEIRNLGYASGVSKSVSTIVTDPMLCYQVSQASGMVPLKFRNDKEFWREFDSLLPGGSNEIPLVIENAITLCRSLKGNWPLGVLVCGQKTKSGQAKVEFWRASSFALPQALLGSADVRAFLHSILLSVEEVADELKSALWRYYRYILIHDEQKTAKDLRKEEKTAIGKMVDAAEPLHFYWSTLESRFHGILRDYTTERDSDDLRCEWLRSVWDTLKQAWEQHNVSVSMGDAWSIRALVKAEGPVLSKLKELNDEIMKLQPQEEDE
jgi:CRISPR system Cascade subunit CasA